MLSQAERAGPRRNRPTTSIWSRINALNIALQKYEGTVFLVTHDEDLMEEVGTRVWHLEPGKLTDFKGTYEEYEATLAS
jgi:ATPase subunit of ABC transporter with duplicated ATPase domains